MPAVEFTNWLISITNKDIELIDGTEFDTVEHEGKTFWVNKKFIVKGSQGAPGGGSKRHVKLRRNSIKSFLLNSDFIMKQLLSRNVLM